MQWGCRLIFLAAGEKKIYTRWHCRWDIIHQIEYRLQYKWQSREISCIWERHSIFSRQRSLLSLSPSFSPCVVHRRFLAVVTTHPQASTFEYISRVMSTDVCARLIALSYLQQQYNSLHIHTGELMSALFLLNAWVCVCVCASKHSIVDDSPSAQHVVKLPLSLSLSVSSCRSSCLQEMCVFERLLVLSKSLGASWSIISSYWLSILRSTDTLSLVLSSPRINHNCESRFALTLKERREKKRPVQSPERRNSSWKFFLFLQLSPSMWRRHWTGYYQPFLCLDLVRERCQI